MKGWSGEEETKQKGREKRFGERGIEKFKRERKEGRIRNKRED